MFGVGVVCACDRPGVTVQSDLGVVSRTLLALFPRVLLLLCLKWKALATCGCLKGVRLNVGSRWHRPCLAVPDSHTAGAVPWAAWSGGRRRSVMPLGAARVGVLLTVLPSHSCDWRRE